MATVLKSFAKMFGLPTRKRGRGRTAQVTKYARRNKNGRAVSVTRGEWFKTLRKSGNHNYARTVNGKKTAMSRADFLKSIKMKK